MEDARLDGAFSLYFIVNTGGNAIEELMNDDETNMFINAPRAMICVAVKSQVALLTELHKDGLL